METSNPKMLNSAREKLKQVKNVKFYEGVCYVWLDFEHEPNFDTLFQRIRNIVFTPNDIILSGFPRSGNHWSFEITQMVLHQRVQFEDNMMFAYSLESAGTPMQHPMMSTVTDCPKIYTGHLTLDVLSECLMENGVKVVYILRNPKDAIASSYNLMRYYKDDRIRLEMSWDEFFELQLVGEVPWGSWFDHVLKTEAFMNKHPKCPVFVMQYEKLQEDPIKEVKRLCHFMGQPENLAEDIAKITSFASMQKGAKAKMAVYEKNFWTEEFKFLRKGKIGSWKSIFTVDQSERFDRVFEEKCAGSWMADLVREYI